MTEFQFNERMIQITKELQLQHVIYRGKLSAFREHIKKLELTSSNVGNTNTGGLR